MLTLVGNILVQREIAVMKKTILIDLFFYLILLWGRIINLFWINLYILLKKS